MPHQCRYRRVFRRAAYGCSAGASRIGRAAGVVQLGEVRRQLAAVELGQRQTPERLVFRSGACQQASGQLVVEAAPVGDAGQAIALRLLVVTRGSTTLDYRTRVDIGTSTGSIDVSGFAVDGGDRLDFTVGVDGELLLVALELAPIDVALVVILENCGDIIPNSDYEDIIDEVVESDRVADFDQRRALKYLVILSGFIHYPLAILE